MKFWPGLKDSKNDLKIETKRDGTFVTEADLASTMIIEEGLRKKFPGDFILSEEGDNHEVDLRKYARAWVIDPLDGTHPFIAGRDDFSVLISLVEFGKPTIGIMYFPAKDKLIAASVQGKTVENGSKILSVTNGTTLRERCTYVRNCELKLHEKFIAPRVDSGFAFYSVAGGTFDGVIIKMTTYKVWDIAAPMVVILAAAGKVSDQNGDDVILSGISLEGNYFVACAPQHHAELLSSIEL